MTEAAREWLVGLQGHKDLLSFHEVVRLIKGGQLRENELIKRGNEPWRAAADVPEFFPFYGQRKEPTRPMETAEDVRPGTASIRSKKTTTTVPKVEMEPPKPQRPSATRFRRPRPRPGPDETQTATDKEGIRDEDRPKRPPKSRLKVERVTIRLEPMVMKYFSITDLTRHAAFAFVPRKLLMAAVILLPVCVVIGILQAVKPLENRLVERILDVSSIVLLVYAIATTCTALAFVTRRNLEGDDPPLSELVLYTGANIGAVLLYPLAALLPTFLGAAFLWVFGFLRDVGEGMATAFRAGYILFFVLGIVAVSGVLLLELALCYIPSSMAVDAHRLRKSIREAMGYVRRHPMRVIFHWLVITTTVAVTGAVLYCLLMLAFGLPEFVFGAPPMDTGAAAGWGKLQGLMVVYAFIAVGLALVIPVSILSTFGVLSYLILKQEDEIYEAGLPGDDADDVEDLPPPETDLSESPAPPPEPPKEPAPDMPPLLDPGGEQKPT